MKSKLAQRARHAAAAAVLAAFAVPAAAVVTQLDVLTISKNGTVLFSDTFSDGVPPPVAPGEFSTYLFPTGTFVESGGKLTIDSATGPITTNAAGGLARTTRATFSTNIVDSDLSTGLKSNHTFSVTAVFSLVPSTIGGDNYGIRLGDRDAFGNVNGGPTFGNDFVELRVSHSAATGERSVTFRRQDFQADTIGTLASFPIAPATFGANDQIALVLSKDDAASDLITASFAFLSGGVAGSFTTFGVKSPIFHGENWTRAEFVASQAISAPIPEPQTYALMLAGMGLIGWQLRRKLQHAAARRIA